MICKRDDSETDGSCYKGEDLQKFALESPEKYYIPLDYHTRITENLRFKIEKLRDDATLFKGATYFLSAVLLAVTVVSFTVHTHR